MAQSGNIDIIAQVARGMANFAKCETREIMQGMLSYLLTNVPQKLHNCVNR